MGRKSKHSVVKTIEELKLFTKTGVVVGTSNWSETHVSGGSSGGGGHIHQGTGYVAAPTVSISSTVVERNRFFLRQASGKEVEVDLHGTRFGVRDGHEVTAVYCGHKDSDWGWLFELQNHDTGANSKIATAPPSIRGGGMSGGVFVAFVAGALIAWLMTQTIIAGLLVMGVCFWMAHQCKQRLIAIDHEIMRRAEALIRDAEEARRARPEMLESNAATA